MRAQLTKTALTAGIALATALTLSCSDDKDDGGGEPSPNASSPSVGSSSSVGNFVGSSSSGSNLGGSSSSGSNLGGSSSSRGNVVSSSSNGGGGGGVVPGPSVNYGGGPYQTVVIGAQTWMARNLNYEPSGTGVATNSKCYNGKTSNCTTYGRLYDWATAMNLPSSCNTSICASSVTAKHQGICPSGWHIPSEADWDALMTAVGGFGTAGKYLKASDWNINGEDKFGFAALPGGNGYSDGVFEHLGTSGYWWSANEYDSYNVYSRGMYYDDDDVGYSIGNKIILFSVRCLQD